MESLWSIATLYSLSFGTSAFAQLVQVFFIFLIAYTVLYLGAGVLNVVGIYSRATQVLLPNLYDNSTTITIPQNPNERSAITIYPSVNAPAGMEFSYAAWILLNKSTFGAGSNGLRHIFHKGSATYKPLMCPGVFVKENDNTLVVHMNEAGDWNTSCELPNIPVGKFFHLAIVVRNMNVDMYINGNIAYRMQLKSIPRQNFGDVYAFSTQTINDSAMNPDKPLIVAGAAQGLLSRLTYTGYALNYEQIDRMIRDGPSTKLVSSTQNLPPYFADSWWVTYTRP
jgi:hypothetical protein